MTEVMDMDFTEEKMWKVEPLSPEQTAPDYLDIEQLLESSTCYDHKEFLIGDRAEIASKLLEDLDTFVKNEDQQFPGWFEEKTDLPIFDVLPQLVTYESANVGSGHQLNDGLMKPELTSLDYHRLETPLPQPTFQPLPTVASPLFVPVDESDTSQLLQEFDEYVSSQQEILTPPDSPRDVDIINLLQQMQSSELDALVASRVDDSLFSKPVEETEANSPGCVSVSSSVCGGEESDSSFPISDSGSEDQEWLPPSSSDSSCGPTRSRETKKKKSGGRAPYSRSEAGPDERKLRKKEQNKNAATRYRQKKKAEVEGILGEEKGLQMKNDELKLKLTDLQREIKYLKSFMRDVCRAKGYIK